jgi:hypothetical protein
MNEIFPTLQLKQLDLCSHKVEASIGEGYEDKSKGQIFYSGKLLCSRHGNVPLRVRFILSVIYPWKSFLSFIVSFRLSFFVSLH